MGSILKFFDMKLNLNFFILKNSNRLIKEYENNPKNNDSIELLENVRTIPSIDNSTTEPLIKMLWMVFWSNNAETKAKQYINPILCWLSSFLKSTEFSEFNSPRLKPKIKAIQ